MSEKQIAEAAVFPAWLRYLLGAMCVLLVLLVLAGAISMPFIFESQSIRYKLGFDKTLLRTGKVFGMTAATLLLLQLILSGRFKILDRILGLNRLYIIHRINAVTIATLAVLHPLFVFAPEDITTLPLEFKFWPEVLGASLFLSIWTITATGLFRRFLNLPFNLWWLAHRTAVFFVAVIVFIHVLNVSDSFAAGEVPRLIIFIVGGVYWLVFCWVKLKSFLPARKPYKVTNITQSAKNTYSVEVAPYQNNTFKYIPGQFAFISLQSERLPPEEHPFTISSSPTRPEHLQFSIHCSGDWTQNIGRVVPGDKASIDGPYGLFSHLAHAKDKELILIAGGIGITPMLSMLRYMADVDDQRMITLVWSNRTDGDRVFADEFEELAQKLKGLNIFHVYTRMAHAKKGSARLDKQKLLKLLKDCDKKAAVFICGPPNMMKTIKQILIQIGFPRRFIFTEEFAL